MSWPGMNYDIEKSASQWEIYKKIKGANSKDLLKSHIDLMKR